MNKPTHAPENAPPLLEAREAVKTYVMGRRRLEVLRGVSLAVRAGDFLALRGASGAGKSTLLHLLGGLDLPDSGEVRFGGGNLLEMPASALARFRNERVGFIFQAYHLLPELSAFENVCLPARMARMDSAEAAMRARGLLERVGLGGRMEHRPYELSGGEQQRVAIARALVNRPEIILADEPTGNLDSRTGGEIMDLLCALRAERGAVLVVATHDAAVAARAPKIVTLLDGLIRPEQPA